jgi:hypothetical protein
VEEDVEGNQTREDRIAGHRNTISITDCTDKVGTLASRS